MRTHSKTPLFLMELVIMLLVFSISAAVCLRVFAGAQNISKQSHQLDHAVLEAQKASERWKASHGNLEETAAYMGALPDENGFSVFYEEEWLTMEFTCNESTADIVLLNGKEEIFSIECEAVMFGG